MSLFLGNLSHRIRQEDLERVFRRFGRSNVQLKDGYGFVIYDVPSNAERALRVLRGKSICGERISLTWSNKQPRPFKKFARSTRFSESYCERNFRTGEDNSVRNRGSQDRRDFTIGTKYSNRNRGVPVSDVVKDSEDHVGDKGPESKEVMLDVDGTIEPNLEDDDRWGAPISDSLSDHAAQNGSEFDRYEPYHGYDGRDEIENHKKTISSERAQREQSLDHSKPQLVCYNCGLTGHIMRNCPRSDGLRREKFSRFGRRRDDEINFRGRGEGRFERARGRLSAQGGKLLTKRRMNDTKPSGSGKLKKLAKKSGDLHESKNHSNRIGRDGHRKKRRGDHETLKKHHRKRARSASSWSCSDSATSSSRSHSASSKSVLKISSRSHSQSISMRSRSASSTSRSASQSSYSRSKRSKLKSRSSSSGPFSLPISLGQQSPNSPSKACMDGTGNPPKDQSEHAMGPVTEEHLLEQKHSVGDMSLEHLEPNIMNIAQMDQNVGHVYDDGHCSVLRNEYLERSPHVLTSEEGAFAVANYSLDNNGEMDDHTGSPLGKQVPVSCLAMNSSRISSQEMCMVLKHYGMAAPEESEVNAPVNVCLGAARLWPWELVYYRRLKKGPISTENYARRVAQNTEFGIVDKYIRSSSGWVECDENNS